MLDGSSCDERIWESDPGFPPDSASAFSDNPIDFDLPKRSKNNRNRITGRVTSKQFCPGDNGKMEPMRLGFERPRATKVVDEDIGVDQIVSHDPIRLEMAP